MSYQTDWMLAQPLEKFLESDLLVQELEYCCWILSRTVALCICRFICGYTHRIGCWSTLVYHRTIGLLAFLAHEFAHYLEKFSVYLLVQVLAWKMGLREGVCSRDSS